MQYRGRPYEGINGKVRRTVDRGVPQGSVLGPLLWNVGYNTVLEAALPKGVFVTCYAADTLLLACGKDWSRTIRLMEAGLEAVVRKITSLGLEVATNKTESSWFHGLPQNRSPPESWIAVRDDRIKVGTTIKYLGLVLDGRLNFETHFAQLAPRVEKVALSLDRMLPNIGVPKESVRRLYTAITQSMMLYGAPVWARRRQMTRRNIKTLRSVQRRMVLRTIRAYRIVSTEAALALAGMTPFDHLSRAYAETYWGSCGSEDQGQVPASEQENLKQRAILRARSRWKRELQRPRAARKRAIEAVMPSWERWMEAGPALLTFRVTQVLTPYGCFGEYLRKIGAEQTTACHHCDAGLDSAKHTTEECKAFEVQRAKLTSRSLGTTCHRRH